MGGGSKTSSQYHSYADLHLLISGLDNLEDGMQLPAKIPGIMSGMVVHGKVVLRAPELPPLGALVKVKLKSKMLRHISKIVGGETSGDPFALGAAPKTVTERVKWFQHSFRYTLFPVSGAPYGNGQVDSTGMHRVDLPISLPIPPNLPNTMEPDDRTFVDSGGKRQKFEVTYTIRVKVKFDNYQHMFKSRMRPIEILRGPLTISEMSTLGAASIGTDIGWKEVSDTAGKVHVKARPAAVGYYGGDTVVIETTINNQLNKQLNLADMRITEEIEYTVQNLDRKTFSVDRTKPTRVGGSSDLILYELGIMSKTTVDRSFGIRLPRVMEPPSTYLKHGDKEKMEVKHYVNLVFHLPGGLMGTRWTPLSVKFPIRVLPNPSLYLASPPIYGLAPTGPPGAAPGSASFSRVQTNGSSGSMSLASMSSAFYNVYPQTRVFCVFVMSATDLPKMDPGFNGKADPFVVLLLNGKHYRCTKFIPKSRKPIWSEEFRFPLSEAEAGLPLSLQVKVYDYDATSQNDFIGELIGGITPDPQYNNLEREYVLEKQGNGRRKAKTNRGKIELKYYWTT
uniref:C2 domain-containing protein n=1 Tax=Rhodosorus marinus TaxID=101924 RepID=A0A7S2ZVA3_9RHOD|mmetsp:Transcript_33004/g.129586  ORF Transcript_33004/g.129586 Transcript_33004/m.129586 type:complete len:564 (+) Transcript_33004:307-1998(+)|eukprot:CAMPEP_0113960678 /NCGR_PEP_ID=MMETSP0011_2-20120614/4859_1 /TAXON_ID=101924 /ORGANISM="Rhodosorus marinus" /LENGTH=563 /DNA_ID=CAMNT_0000972179 /DNA_START=435 /DNA_END=2126 /DNA_ORIENTATION=+ /assembly_acc=CAM_ASM_000156